MDDSLESLPAAAITPQIDEKRRKRIDLSIDDKVKVIQAVEDGFKQKDVAEQFAISKQTVSDIIKAKDVLLERYHKLGSDNAKIYKRIRQSNISEIEDGIFNWLRKDCGPQSPNRAIFEKDVNVARKMIREKAIECRDILIEKINTSDYTSDQNKLLMSKLQGFTASDSWLNGFCQRNRLIIQTAGDSESDMDPNVRMRVEVGASGFGVSDVLLNAVSMSSSMAKGLESLQPTLSMDDGNSPFLNVQGEAGVTSGKSMGSGNFSIEQNFSAKKRKTYKNSYNKSQSPNEGYDPLMAGGMNGISGATFHNVLGENALLLSNYDNILAKQWNNLQLAITNLESVLVFCQTSASYDNRYLQVIDTLNQAKLQFAEILAFNVEESEAMKRSKGGDTPTSNSSETNQVDASKAI